MPLPIGKNFNEYAMPFQFAMTFTRQGVRGHTVSHETENAANCMSEQRQRPILIEENQQI